MNNKRWFLTRQIGFVAILFALVFVFVSPASADNWHIGKIVGLCKGTHICRGPGENYGYHTIVPENDWAVMIIVGPQGDWWDTSRKAAGDPSGGTGWVKKSEAESCKQSAPNPPPPQQQAPASSQLVNGVSLSKTQVNPGDRIDGSFMVRNNGGQDWQPQRLGIAVNGPSYLDFGWREGLTIRPGDSISFLGAIPTAPNVPGTYPVSVSWQDSGGSWRSLGGNTSFTILKQISVPPISQPSTSSSSSSAQPRNQSTGSKSQQSTPPVILPDFGAPKINAPSAQLTDEARKKADENLARLSEWSKAKAREWFTGENYKKLMDNLQFAADSEQCLADVIFVITPILQSGGTMIMVNPAPLDMPDHCASAANDILDLIGKNQSDVITQQKNQTTTQVISSPNETDSKYLSDSADILLDCTPIIKGIRKDVIRGIRVAGTEKQVWDALSDSHTIPDSVFKNFLNMVPGYGDVLSCSLTVIQKGQDMEFQAWLEGKAASGLYWTADEFLNWFPTYNQFMNCLPLPGNDDRTNCP